METIILIIIIAITTTAFGILIGRYQFPVSKVKDQIELSDARGTIGRLENELVGMKARSNTLESDLKNIADALQAEEKKSARLEEREAALAKQATDVSDALASALREKSVAESDGRLAGESVARLTERERALVEDVNALGIEVSNLTSARDEILLQLRKSGEDVVRLEEQAKAFEKEAAELRTQQGGLHESVKAEFENIATKILKANAAELSDSSQKNIAAILDPLRERIQEFQIKVESTYDAEKREVLSLKEQIRLVIETSRDLGTQADDLAKARKGDVQMLGRWGELVLDRILQSAGLQEGREYISQGRGLGLKDETGASQKPDVVVLLPEGRTMIVDSKVSLSSYDRLIVVKEEAERAEWGRQFVRDMKAHIDGLAGKRYQDNDKMAAHDCVLMFVPIEGALAAALTVEPELFTYAWDKRVVLVGPPTLLMTFRTVASIWRYELQAQNAQEIARLAGALCDKVSASLGDLNAVAERMNQALEAHNEAVKRLSTGRGNALSIGERIRSLGVRTKLPMPAMMVDGEKVAAALDDHAEEIAVEDRELSV